MKPLATSRALNRSIPPFSIYLISNIYLLEIIFAFSGASTTLNVRFASNILISNLTAICYLRRNILSPTASI